MSAVATIPAVYLRKCSGGAVVAFYDEEMKRPAATWAAYATNRPDMRQRYVTINLQSHRALWRQ